MTAADAPRSRPRPIVLLILDGFGTGRDPAGDAVAAAPMPVWRGLLARWPQHVSPLLARWLRHGQQYGQV